eukprot:scaffold2302_cov209-Ochromonas_danica.AAC.2
MSDFVGQECTEVATLIKVVELSSLSHEETIELLIQLGCCPDLDELCQKHFTVSSEVNDRHLVEMKEVKQLRELGDNKSSESQLEHVLRELQSLEREGVPLHLMQGIRQSLLLKDIKRNLLRMATSGEVTTLRELEALGSIGKIPSEDINRGFTADLNDERFGKGWEGVTALHISAARGHAEMVRLLLLHPEIAVNVVDSEHETTPFYAACSGGHAAVVKYLLADGRVDVMKANECQTTPFYAACSHGHVAVVKYLLADNKVDVMKANEVLLWLVVVFIEMLDANVIIPYEITPFCAACSGGHVEIVKLLLSDSRVDQDIVKADYRQTTPFSAACSSGHWEVVKLLLADSRVDVNKVDQDGFSPFYNACLLGHMEVVKLLLADNRVDVNQVEQVNGWSPLYVSCFGCGWKLVRLLLEDSRVDVNKATKDGTTPLDVVDDKEIIQLLKKRGARRGSRRR